MSETTTTSPAPSPSASHRIDDIDPPWRARPAILSAFCALAGILFYNLIENAKAESLAALVAIATIVFVMTVERRRIVWAAGFALLWGAVIALIVENNRGYNVNASPIEWPFWSGLLAIVVAAPLFQTWRDTAASAREWRWWKLPYDRLHLHAWTDAVIGAAAGVFVGISFALAFLITAMFDLIGIDVFRKLLNEGWFGMALAGTAFGGAVGLLRERDKLVGTLQRLVMVVLSVLAPVLAVALLLFLISLLGTGLTRLWASGFSTAAMMLGAAAFAVLLANAVIGNGDEDRTSNPLLHWAALALAVAVLPLAAIAFYSMHLRVIQYGWTPERLWGFVAVVVALSYGLVGLWSLLRGRRNFDDVLRPMQQKLAIGLMLLATFLALPIMDFGAISTRDQLARLENGQTKPENFDWAAMAFDFGPDGRAALAQIAKSPDRVRADAAKMALAAENRWDLASGGDVDVLRPVEKMVRVLPADRPLTPELYSILRRDGLCRVDTCVAMWRGEDWLVVVGRYSADGELDSYWLKRAPDGKQWVRNFPGEKLVGGAETSAINLSKANVAVEAVTLQQLTVGGEPVGQPFAE